MIVFRLFTLFEISGKQIKSLWSNRKFSATFQILDAMSYLTSPRPMSKVAEPMKTKNLETMLDFFGPRNKGF